MPRTVPSPATDAANPRAYGSGGNANGHIIRLPRDGRRLGSATTFTWDIYLFGSPAAADATNVNLSGLTAGNDFSSPDGVWFDTQGVCWIQTDDGAYTGTTNCMMLAAIPGSVGDGGPRIGDQHRWRRHRHRDHPHWRCANGSQPAALPRGPEGLRDHGHRDYARPQDAVRQHPASGREHLGGATCWPARRRAAGPPAARRGRVRRRWSITRDDGGTIGAHLV